MFFCVAAADGEEPGMNFVHINKVLLLIKKG